MTTDTYDLCVQATFFTDHFHLFCWLFRKPPCSPVILCVEAIPQLWTLILFFKLFYQIILKLRWLCLHTEFSNLKTWINHRHANTIRVGGALCMCWLSLIIIPTSLPFLFIFLCFKTNNDEASLLPLHAAYFSLKVLWLLVVFYYWTVSTSHMKYQETW